MVEVERVGCKFSLKDFYVQTIEKFVVAIPDMIESCRIAKKVSGNQKNVKKQRGGLALSKVRYLNLKGKDMQKVDFFRYL